MSLVLLFLYIRFQPPQDADLPRLPDYETLCRCGVETVKEAKKRKRPRSWLTKRLIP